MSILSTTVGKRIRSCRLRLGLSQEKLAEAAGFHPTYVGQLERGEKNMTIDSLDRICRALGVSISQLLEGLGGEPTQRGIPMQCCDVVTAMSPGGQDHALNILREILAMEK